MAEPQEQSGNETPNLLIEVRFLPRSRCLFLFAENPTDPVHLPPDDVLRQITVRLQGTAPSTRRTAARTVDVPYRIVDRIGGVPARKLGQHSIRILMLEPLSELAQAGEERIRRSVEGSACVKQVHLHWPDGREETYARRPGHRQVFSRVTSS